MTATPTPEKPAKTKKKLTKKKKIIIIISVVLAVIVAFISTFFLIVKLGEAKLRKSLVSTEGFANDDTDDTAVYHNGKAYYYNKNLVNILFLGVDRVQDSKETQGQADAIYLFSVDTKDNKVMVVSISRNTVCEVDILNSEGENYGVEEQQICLAYAYGNTDKRSSENCTKAVSKLLYGIPINGYYTLHLDSIAQIVDSVGGVTVTIPNDFPNHIFSGQHGKTIKIYGKNALSYLQTRGDSNAPRVERHRDFISSFIKSAKSAVKNDLSLPFDLAKKLSREATTNIDISSVVYLATKALDWKIDFANVAGEYSIENNVELLTVDADALRQLVIDSFYTDKKQ